MDSSWNENLNHDNICCLKQNASNALEKYLGNAPCKRATICKNHSPHVFYFELVISIELHEETHGPKITNRFTRFRMIRANDTGSCVSHYRIVSSVEKFYREFFQKQPHAQRGRTFTCRVFHRPFVYWFWYFVLCYNQIILLQEN